MISNHLEIHYCTHILSWHVRTSAYTLPVVSYPISHVVLTVQTSLLFTEGVAEVGFSLSVVGGGRVTTGPGGGKVAEGLKGLC